jgi:hypothetical protein
MARSFPQVPGSLVAALAVVPELRRPTGWDSVHPPLSLAALLALGVTGMVGGAHSLSAVVQWGEARA